jgi:hypothetical protein
MQRWTAPRSALLRTAGAVSLLTRRLVTAPVAARAAAATASASALPQRALSTACRWRPTKAVFTPARVQARSISSIVCSTPSCAVVAPSACSCLSPSPFCLGRVRCRSVRLRPWRIACSLNATTKSVRRLSLCVAQACLVLSCDVICWVFLFFGFVSFAVA